MASWIDDITNWVNQNVPGAGEIHKVGSEFGQAVQQYPGQLASGVSNLWQSGLLSPVLSALGMTGGGGGGGGGGGSTKATTTPAASTSGAALPAPPTSSPTDDAVTMGIGMFFQNYLAPLIQKTNQANQNVTAEWGTAMQNALQQPMPAGVKQALQADMPQEMFLQSLANQAGYQQAMGTIPYQQMIQGLGAETAAQQSEQEYFSRAVTESLLNQGLSAQAVAAISPYLGGLSRSLLEAGGTQAAGTSAATGANAPQPSSSPTNQNPNAAAAQVGATAGTTPSTYSSGVQQAAQNIQKSVSNGTITTAQAVQLLESLGYTVADAQNIAQQATGQAATTATGTTPTG